MNIWDVQGVVLDSNVNSRSRILALILSDRQLSSMAVVLTSPRLGIATKPRKSQYAPRRCAASSISKDAVHILGVNGTGMLPVTALALWQGYDVRGSDKNAFSSDVQNIQGLKLLHGRLQVGFHP